MYVGGLIANNDGTNAVVQGGANKGNFDIFYDIKPAESSYVGGLVAYSKGASSMSYCYNIGNMLVRAEYNVVLNNTYVGGLVGGTTQDNISYSYVNANFTTTVANFNVYQLIGKGRTDSQSSAQNVYYNASQNTGAINGTMGSGVKSFTTTPQDAQLYGSGTLFNKGDLDGVNPRLDWEAKLFETIEWHSDRPVA